MNKIAKSLATVAAAVCLASTVNAMPAQAATQDASASGNVTTSMIMLPRLPRLPYPPVPYPYPYPVCPPIWLDDPIMTNTSSVNITILPICPR